MPASCPSITSQSFFAVLGRDREVGVAVPLVDGSLPISTKSSESIRASWPLEVKYFEAVVRLFVAMSRIDVLIYGLADKHEADVISGVRYLLLWNILRRSTKRP
jgi:hypothetical protein